MNQQATSGNGNSNGGGKGPQKVFGKSIRLSVWRNNKGNGDFATFKVERRYKDSDGGWKSSSSFTLAQLLRLQALIGKAVAEYVDEDSDGLEQPAND